YLAKHLLDGLNLETAIGSDRKSKSCTARRDPIAVSRLKKPCGLISTVETVIGENRFFSTLTTHDVISNQKCLKEMVMKGSKAAVLEVSSHGLDQCRVEEIAFDVGIFTNMYPDHLD